MNAKQGESGAATGRPRLEFDLQAVYDLGKVGCTYEDIAAHFGCSVRTIKARMTETTTDEAGDPVESPMRQAFERGLGECRHSLRSVQMKKALAGDGTMLVWLGKQLLGQKDRSTQEVCGVDGGPIKTEAKVIAVPAIDENQPE